MMNFFRPSTQLERREYSYSFQKDKNKVSFDFDIKYEYHSEKKLVNITRSNLLINDEKPDETLMGNLAFQASEALFPLILQVNSSGYPIVIFNHFEILERWKSFISGFQDYYDNPLSVKLLNRIGKLYKNPQKLLDGLQNEWFFASFFFPLYSEYRNNESVELDFPFPSVAGNKIYKTELQFNDEKTDKGKNTISLCGYSSINESNKVEGYFLMNSDRSIHNIKMDFIFADIRQNIQISIIETKEVAERKTAINVVFDAKEQQEKLRNSNSFFVEEIMDSSILPKHK